MISPRSDRVGGTYVLVAQVPSAGGDGMLTTKRGSAQDKGAPAVRMLGLERDGCGGSSFPFPWMQLTAAGITLA